jgi:hypothetical protein
LNGKRGRRGRSTKVMKKLTANKTRSNGRSKKSSGDRWKKKIELGDGLAGKGYER